MSERTQQLLKRATAQGYWPGADRPPGLLPLSGIADAPEMDFADSAPVDLGCTTESFATIGARPPSPLRMRTPRIVPPRTPLRAMTGSYVPTLIDPVMGPRRAQEDLMRKEVDVEEARAILAEAAGHVPPEADESIQDERAAERRRARRRPMRKPLGGPAAPRVQPQLCEVDAAVVGVGATKLQSPTHRPSAPSHGYPANDSASSQDAGGAQVGDALVLTATPVPGNFDSQEGSQSPRGQSPRDSFGQRRGKPLSAKGARPAALEAALSSEGFIASGLKGMHVHPTSPNTPTAYSPLGPASIVSTSRGTPVPASPLVPSRVATTTLDCPHDFGLPLEMSVQTEESDLAAAAPPPPAELLEGGKRNRILRNGRTVIVQRCDPQHIDLRRWDPVEWQSEPPSEEMRYLAHVRSRFPGTIDSVALSGKRAPGAVKRSARTPRAY